MTDRSQQTDGPRDAATPPAPLGSLPVTARGPLSNLADLADLLGGDSRRSRVFLRGLIVGALVGAAVAGTSLRRRGRSG